jgi:hypothetical protein
LQLLNQHQWIGLAPDLLTPDDDEEEEEEEAAAEEQEEETG